MVISHGVVGSAHLSRISDSKPVNATKLLIGVKISVEYFGVEKRRQADGLFFGQLTVSSINVVQVILDAEQ